MYEIDKVNEYNPLQTIEEIIQSSFFDLKGEKPAFVQNDNFTAIANATTTDVPGTSITIQPGTYLLEADGDAGVQGSGLPTNSRCALSWYDDANNDLDPTSLSNGMAAVNTTDMRTHYRQSITYSTSVAVTIKLRAFVGANGGTVTNRDMRNIIGKVTKLD